MKDVIKAYRDRHRIIWLIGPSAAMPGNMIMENKEGHLSTFMAEHLETLARCPEFDFRAQ